MSEHEKQPPVKSSQLRPWQKPELTEYGSIAKLTQSGGSTRTEAGVPQMRMG